VWHYRKDGSQFPIEIHAGLVNINGRSYILGFDRDITSRKLAEEISRMYIDRIRQLNVELNHKATDLAAANNELEAFNYSVSHDMRGPLTRILGYCQLLLEDEQDADQQTRMYISRINDAGLWLSEMIDSLLCLARLSRDEIFPNEVNLSNIAENIVQELRLSEPDRAVKSVIAKNISVRGDARLLKIMMANLIGNAWKYSSHNSDALIEFGTCPTDTVPIYFVRDNGAGFDMKYADKLFRVFTRLHDSSQFKGTGIGLATVQRVVARHGGRVWAEAETGRGAIFFFTLQSESTYPVLGDSAHSLSFDGQGLPVL
jgi:light-regulated signal transduction histidine kinase (bacteriophytochrome)